jgi:hypothetical protein
MVNVAAFTISDFIAVASCATYVSAVVLFSFEQLEKSTRVATAIMKVNLIMTINFFCIIYFFESP